MSKHAADKVEEGLRDEPEDGPVKRAYLRLERLAAKETPTGSFWMAKPLIGIVAARELVKAQDEIDVARAVIEARNEHIKELKLQLKLAKIWPRDGKP